MNSNAVFFIYVIVKFSCIAFVVYSVMMSDLSTILKVFLTILSLICMSTDVRVEYIEEAEKEVKNDE